MVGSRTSGRTQLLGGWQPAVVIRGREKPRPWHSAEMHRPPDLLIRTNILPSSFTWPPYLIPLCPFSLDLMHCRGRGTALENQHGRFPPPLPFHAEIFGRFVPLPPPGTHHHGARVPSFAPRGPHIERTNTPPWAMEGPCPSRAMDAPCPCPWTWVPSSAPGGSSLLPSPFDSFPFSPSLPPTRRCA